MAYLQSFTRRELAEFLRPICRQVAQRRRRDASEETLKEQALKKSVYHARQIFSFFYQQHLTSWEEMSDLSQIMRDWLKENLKIFALTTSTEQRSQDGTVKLLWELEDQKTVESVLIPASGQDANITREGNQFRGAENKAGLDSPAWSRLTTCISSQVGCAMGCKFCLTGEQGLERHLETHEIVAQVAQVAQTVPLSGVVLMGMGEPLHNIDAVLKACQIFRDDAGLALSRRKVTVSTCGLVPEIDRLSAAREVTLAISLNGTTDEQREALMPVNKKWPLASLLEACRRFQGEGKLSITFEYVMLKGINDTLADADRLVALLAGIRSRVNLIPFNPYPGSPYKRSDPQQIEEFKARLIQGGLFVSVRISRGQDILAACGQLRSAAKTTHRARESA